MSPATERAVPAIPGLSTLQCIAAALFRVHEGKLVEFLKEWNKLSMWEQFGWPTEECLTQH
jgi:hypothetical protein